MYRLDQAESGRPKDVVFYYSDYASVGSIDLQGKTFSPILHDQFARGDFSDEVTVIKLDVNEDGKFDFSNESFNIHEPFNIGGTTYEIKGVAASGDSFQVVTSTQKVPETKPLAVVRAGRPAPS